MSDIDGERVTPTGAAIIVTLFDMFGGQDDQPDFAVLEVGYGAGTRNYDDCPNLLRILLGETENDSVYEKDMITILETNIDDMNPQIFGYLLDQLYAGGAVEAFITPVIMKKNRPAQLLTVLCKKSLSDKLCHIIFRETTTTGIRKRDELRDILIRDEKTVKTEYGEIRYKKLKLFDSYKIQPEYDDCVRTASENNIPLARVLDMARRAAEMQEGKK
jgi:uncharacterized protein (DUF111 family)